MTFDEGFTDHVRIKVTVIAAGTNSGPEPAVNQGYPLLLENPDGSACGTWLKNADNDPNQEDLEIPAYLRFPVGHD